LNENIIRRHTTSDEAGASREPHGLVVHAWINANDKPELLLFLLLL
jgi:hypothetical protein